MTKLMCGVVVGAISFSFGCRDKAPIEAPLAPPVVANPALVAEPPPSPPDPPVAAAIMTAPPADMATLSLTVIAIDIEPRLAALCNIETNKAFFAFDSAKLEPEAKERLKEIADCTTTKPLTRTKLRIVGHTDPRGPDDYNKQLGKSRAEAVVGFLLDQGIEKSRLEVVSKGEKAAEPNDERGWPFDRRVDIRLAQ